MQTEILASKTKRCFRGIVHISLFSLAYPLLIHAQNTGNVIIFLEEFGAIIALLIPIAFALILLFFFWGLAKYMFGDAEDKEKGKNLMIYGVIALFVAASIWGLVAYLRQVTGVGAGDDPNNPFVVNGTVFR